MANYSLSRIFFAYSDDTRRKILELLHSNELTVSQVAHNFDSKPPTITKHLKVLESAGLVSRRREGRVHYLRLCPEPVEHVSKYFNSHIKLWRKKFENLEKLLEVMES